MMELHWSYDTPVTSTLYNSFNCATLLPGCYPETGHTTYSPVLPCKLLFFTPYLLLFLLVWGFGCLILFSIAFLFFYSRESQVFPGEEHTTQRDVLGSWTPDREDTLQSWMFPEPHVPKW